MATAKLTKRFVDAQSATGEEQVFWDAELRGFCLRVSAAGHKSYGIKYRTKGGTQRRYSLGAHGELTPDQARAAAQNAFAQVRAGADPASDARAYREASDLAALASDFLVHRPLRPETRRQYDSLLARFILPRMRHRKVAEVDRGTVARLFHEMSASGPTQANRALALLSVMFSHAVTTGARSDNPCHGIKRNPERNRERFLERDEIGRLLRACAEHPDERAANFVRLLLYTGARRTETLTATWDMFDLEAGIWTKPSHHTKQKRLHRVPLSDPAIALLRAMKAQAGEGARFVFPRPEADAPLREPKRPVRGIFAAAGIKDATYTRCGIQWRRSWRALGFPRRSSAARSATRRQRQRRSTCTLPMRRCGWR